MTSVGIRELKANLSACLRRVRQGEPLQITDRGNVVAEIVPAGWTSAQPVPPGLLAAAREGKVRLATRPWSPPRSPLRRPLPPGTVQRLLDEDRGER
ncbi:MAG TPA: type II toxin-antitoxin system prevent-host-death family antitoxin [Terriglobales bacterium]|nr:type II toxin-antitoxin system prevent-host-death family antitoxin [Terriglobales bacterium]